MDVIINNRTTKLEDKNYLSEGGEGVIYAKNDLVYKIYHSHIQKFNLSQKFNDLKTLSKSNIINPLNVIFDNSNKEIGYQYKWIKNSIAIQKMFSNDYWKQKNINENTIHKLINNMIEAIVHIHEKDILIVDLNEFNIIYQEANFTMPFFIDVDSYQTKNFPAKVIMPSVRDYHNNKFSKETDWFSMGILISQLYLGIHPFKGRHPRFDKNDFVNRMKSNISIFDKDVSLPPIVRPIDLVPNDMLDWLKVIFSSNKRMPPPIANPLYAVKSNKGWNIIQSNEAVDIKIFKSFNYDILDTPLDDFSFKTINGFYKENMFVKNVKDIYYDKNIKKNISVYFNNNTITLKVENVVIFEKQNILNYILTDEHLFIFEEEALYQLEIQQLKNIIVSVKTKIDLLPSYKIYNNVLIQDTLGAFFIYTFNNGKPLALNIKELKGKKIINIKQNKNIVAVITFDNGLYYMHLIKIGYSNYSFTNLGETDLIECNFTISKIGIIQSNENELTIFFTDLEKKDVKIIRNSGINSDMKLFYYNDNICYFKNKDIFKITLKGK